MPAQRLLNALDDADYSDHLLNLLLRPTTWIPRRVIHVEFIDTETLKIRVGLDVDLSASDAARAYLSYVETNSLPLLIPLGLRQKGVTDFHARDYQGRHINLLTRAESIRVEENIRTRLSVPSWRPESSSSRYAALKVTLRQQDTLTFVEVSHDYFSRHDLGYEYHGPFGLREDEWRSRVERRLSGRPTLVRLRLLHAESAASYHAEVHAPSGTVIFDRLLDHVPTEGDVDLRGTMAGPIFIRDGSFRTGDREGPQWRPDAYATFYVKNVDNGDRTTAQANEGAISDSDSMSAREQLASARGAVEPAGCTREIESLKERLNHLELEVQRHHSKLEQCRSGSVDHQSGYVLNLWMGIDGGSLLRPALASAFVAIFLALRPILDLLEPIIPTLAMNDKNAGTFYQVGSATFLSLATALIGFFLVPGEHSVTNWLFTPARTAVYLAAFISAAGFVIAAAGILVEEHSAGIRTASLIAAVLEASLFVWLVILWVRTRKKSALRYIAKVSYNRATAERPCASDSLDVVSTSALERLARVQRDVG